MMEYYPREPDNALKPYIETLFYLNDYCPDHTKERLVPDGSTNLIIELDNQERFIYDNESSEIKQSCRVAWISGMHREFITISSIPKTKLIAVRFLPGGGFPFFQISLDRLTNQVVDASAIFGEAIVNLRAEIRDIDDPEAKLDELEGFLLQLLVEHGPPPKWITEAVLALKTSPSRTRLEKLIEGSHYSQKHFISSFKKYVGLRPKELQRILRFAEVIPNIHDAGSINWAQLVSDCGYYDQSHFIKDFQRFSGFNPQEFFKAGHDRINFFVSE